MYIKKIIENQNSQNKIKSFMSDEDKSETYNHKNSGLQ